MGGLTNLYGTAEGDDVHDNFVVNFGGNVQSHGQKVTDAGEVSLSVCGTALSGQASHINVGPLPAGGLC